MPATDEQRSWLEKAISEKGRLTRKKSVEKEFAKYIRRRDKVKAAVFGLSWSTNDNEVRNALKAADDVAKNGDFAKAYKQLDSVKKRARAQVVGRGREIALESLSLMIDAFDRTIRNRVVLNNLIEGNLNAALNELKGFEKAKDKATLDDAIAAWTSFSAEEPRIKGMVDEAHKLLVRLTAECKTPDMNNEPRSIGGMLAAAEFAGREAEFSTLKAKFEKARAILDANNAKLAKARVAADLVKAQTLAYEKAVLEIKDMGAWQKREGADVTADADEASKFAIRENVLDPTKNRLGLVEREAERFKWADAQVQKERRRDRSLKPRRGERGEFDVTPEPIPFSSTAVFGDLVAMDEKLPDDIPDQQAADLQREASDKLKAFIGQADADSDELFDLSLKSAKDFQKMLCAELFGTSSTKGLTKSQISLLSNAAKTLEKTLVDETPNKMKEDGSEVSIGGETFTFVETIKSGGNGMARRYKSGDKTIVVKTMLDEREVEKMKKEMRIHRRAMNGIDADDPADSAIVNMKGAALSEKDGAVQVHMVMEDVDGGDLTDMTNATAIMESTGMIPEAARQVLALELLTKTTKALMELERQGLVHHDIKGENVMMTSDGRIKIIDYGESSFGDKDGIVRGRGGNVTKGYDAPEAFGEEFDTRVDSYALGGMIERMVARLTPSGANDFKSGALGKLVKQLKSADPNERPSLEAVLMSSLMQSTGDYARGDVEDLQEASNQMAVLVARETITVDQKTLVREIPRARDWVTQDQVKLKELQDLAEDLSGVILEIERKYENDRDGYLIAKRELEEYKRQRDLLENGLIKKAMADKAAKGKQALDDAVAENKIKIDVTIRGNKRTVTLKDAIAMRDRIVKGIAEKQDEFYKTMSEQMSEDDPDDTARLNAINERFAEMDELRKAIDRDIYDAMGPDARFYLSKVKVEEIGRRFGTPSVQREQPDIKQDFIDDLVGVVIKNREAEAVKRATAAT